MSHLNFCFPEWQGYAESNSVYFGTLAMQKMLGSQHHFDLVEVPENEQLILKNDIMGYEANLRQLKATSQLLLTEKPSSTFMLGGTCASEIAPVSYLNKLYDGDLAIVWFDAHGDLNTPKSSPSKHFHGMPLRALLGESDQAVLDVSHSVLRPEQVVLTGTRDLDEEEEQFINQHQVLVIPPEDLNTLYSTLSSKGYHNVYIHIDLDVLDPPDFPHLLLPIEGGVAIDSLLSTLRTILSDYNVAGSSIVEYVPQGAGDTETIKSIASLFKI